tara:strand:+ start:2089 stop:2427 length:339 start_codon:yes stop_codon:yes gene_type:complete
MVDVKLEGRAAYLRLDGEILKTERDQLNSIHEQILQSTIDIIIIDFTTCKLVEEHCIRSLVQVQACIRSRIKGNVIIMGASSKLKDLLIKKGAVRPPETYDDIQKVKTALAC